MALRREILSYVGTGAIGGIIGYYARARGLLGLQQEPRSVESGPEESASPTAEAITDPPETESPPPETESPPESPTETSPADVLFQDQFKTLDTGYDPDKWTTKRANRGTLTQTERNSLLVSPPSDSYAGIRTNSDFSPPITLNFEIDEWTQAYASGIYVGFLDQEYPSAEHRAAPQKRSRNSIISKFQREDKGLQFITQRDSPIGSGEDTKENQSWNVRTKSEIGWESGEISTVKIDWSGSEAILSIDGEMIFRETENIPDRALSLYIMAHSWVPPGDSELLLRNLRITR